MTNAEVFRWFCKEQGITHFIHRMYYKIQPCKIDYKDGVRKTNMTFDEYIENRIGLNSFAFLLEMIINDYKNKIRLEINFNDYYNFARDLNEKFKPYIRKWNYFIKRNVQLEDSIKIGDLVTFEHWGVIRSLKVDAIEIDTSRIRGTVVSDDSERNGGLYTIYFSNVLGENGNKLRRSYLIKRNRKVYHGSKSR